MLLPRRIWAIALSISSTVAFQDTSPFLLFSSTPIASDYLPSANIARAEVIRESIDYLIQSCDWDNYILVSQPAQTPADISKRGAYLHLRRWLDKTNDNIKAASAVPEVLGDIDMAAIAQQLEVRCRASVEDVDSLAGYVPIGDDSKRVVKIAFPALPQSYSERASKIAEHDSFLNAVVSGMQSQSYIIIYASMPPSTQPSSAPDHELHLYEMDDPFPSALHTDLKRDVNTYESNSTVDSELPLFEKYQFFTPAIFMGGLVATLIFLVLYIGVSAVSSLQVSYFAFSKEMGPAAQKKQQQ